MILIGSSCDSESPDASQELIRNNSTETWMKFSFYAIDLPLHHHLKFEERMELAQHSISPDIKHMRMIELVKCKNIEHLSSILSTHKVVMLTKPRSFYLEPDTFFEYQVVGNWVWLS